MALTEMYKYWGYDSLETGTHPDGTPIYDRAISANDAAEFEELKYSSGIAPIVDCFKIIPGAGLSIVRQPGYASLGGRPAKDPNPKTLTLISGNTYYYVMEGNAEIEYRMAREGVLTAAETPIPPQRDENHYQIILALIDVPSGATEITESMITDTRYNSDYCGVITNKTNYDWGGQLITANDIHDTDTKLIPIKTGSHYSSLRGDGSYSDDVKIGKYQLKPNGENADIEYSSVVAAGATPPTAYTIKSAHSAITNPNNSLNLSDNTTSSQINTSHDGTNLYLCDIVYEYGNLPTLSGLESNIDIELKAKLSGANMPYSRTKLWLVNMDTNTPIEGTSRSLASPSGSVTTVNYHFDTFADLGAHNIGARIYFEEVGPLGPALYLQIFGSDISISFSVDQAVIGKFTPAGIITSPGGTVQTMMIQGILDNTQDILLMKEGIEI